MIQAILNYPEEEVAGLVREIRTCESLDAVAERIVAKDEGFNVDENEDEVFPTENGVSQTPTFEKQLYGKMGDLRLDDGSVRFIGGTSHLIHVSSQDDDDDEADVYEQQENPITSWTEITDNADLVIHLLHMYFTWHYTYFTTLSKTLFYRDFWLGMPPPNTRRKTHYCTPLLVNAILALGCHFTSRSGARENPDDSATAGDHFFREAKRLIMENDEHEKPRLTTVQALALMSVREAGCGREAKGWVYSGMSFRMACDMGLNLNSGQLTTNKYVNGDEAEEDVRRVTFWGCYLFDKCWSNYLGRLPQIPTAIVTVPKFEVFPDEDAAQWSPYTDSGFSQAHAQPARTRAVALQISKLCEISNDLMKYFYNPIDMEKTRGKSTELKLLSEIHTRLEAWRRELPKEMEPKEGGLSSVLVMQYVEMHIMSGVNLLTEDSMFFQLLFIHLFRPFLKYNQATSPLPQTVSPRKLCTQAAGTISKLMRLYKRSHGLRQICNIVVYIVHSACTIHLLNLPGKDAKRDIVHGVKHIEEIAEGWLCARRTLSILSVLARRWKVELPEEATTVLARTDRKFGIYTAPAHSSPARPKSEVMMNPSKVSPPKWQNPMPVPTASGYLNNAQMPSVANVAPATGPVVRSNSDSQRLPPQDANGLQAQQYPSASATPQTVRQRNTGTRQSTGSPSDIFGGVEQLMRDSNDWVYKDQAQLATGFENWTELDMDPSIWENGVVGDGLMIGGTVSGPMSTSMAIPSDQTNVFATNGNNTINGFPVVSGLNSINPYNGMATYNEDEWYQ